jgi:hypothetical protein
MEQACMEDREQQAVLLLPLRQEIKRFNRNKRTKRIQAGGGAGMTETDFTKFFNFMKNNGIQKIGDLLPTDAETLELAKNDTFAEQFGRENKISVEIRGDIYAVLGPVRLTAMLEQIYKDYHEADRTGADAARLAKNDDFIYYVRMKKMEELK